MKHLLLLIAVALVATNCTPNTKAAEEAATSVTEAIMEPTSPKKQLRHVVLFKFKEGTTEAQMGEVEAAFAALPGKIPEIKGFEWGTNNSPEGLDKGFTHCFFLSFDSEEGRAVYLPHPDHKAFGAVLTPYLEDVLVLDYWMEE